MKIFFVATYPTQSTGYSRVANKLSNYLAKHHEVHYFGYHNYPDSFVQRVVDPAIRFIDVIAEEKSRGQDLVYGDKILCEHLDKIKPDLVFIYNDILVVSRLFNVINEKYVIRPFKTMVYIDLVYEYERPDCIKYLDKNSDMILTFSDFWKSHLIHLGIDKDKLEVLYHGYEPVSQDLKNSRQKYGFHKDDFVILNTNRNTYRKALDITVKGFLMFLKKNKMNPHLKLFLTGHLEANSGYNLMHIIESTCIELGLDYNQVTNGHILTPQQRPLSDAAIVQLYDACDLGVNSAIGEGFGLCNLEHAYMGRIQVLARVGAINDIFSDDSALLVDPVASYHISTHTDAHGGLVRVCLASDFADMFQWAYLNRDRCSEMASKNKEIFGEKFNWNKIMDRFGELVERVMG